MDANKWESLEFTGAKTLLRSRAFASAQEELVKFLNEHNIEEEDIKMTGFVLEEREGMSQCTLYAARRTGE